MEHLSGTDARIDLSIQKVSAAEEWGISHEAWKDLNTSLNPLLLSMTEIILCSKEYQEHR